MRGATLLVAALGLGVVVAGCQGQSGLSADEWAWCSNVNHMSREVGDEARTLGLVPPANDAGTTDYAYYWAYYYYRANKVAQLRTEPGFVRACGAAYRASH